MHTVIIRDMGTMAIERMHRNNIPIKRVTPPGLLLIFTITRKKEHIMDNKYYTEVL